MRTEDTLLLDNYVYFFSFSFRKRSLEEYDDDYKPLSKRLHSMYLKDGPALTSENVLIDTNGFGVSIILYIVFCFF